jgi:hypothetical protein
MLYLLLAQHRFFRCYSLQVFRCSTLGWSLHRHLHRHLHLHYQHPLMPETQKA